MVFDLERYATSVSFVVFGAAALVILVLGKKLAVRADRLADVTGLGEALTGALLLGATTSLPGVITSVTAAAEGHAPLAISNAVGGIAVQTFFIGVADFAYRRANLEHAAADATNLLNGTLLIVLLSLPLIAFLTPEFSVFGVHPCTPLLLAAYLFGVRIVEKHRREPMWGPTETVDTALDVPDEEQTSGRTRTRLVAGFVVLAIFVGLAGWATVRSATVIVERTPLSQGVVGAVMTSVSTSLPELVTTLAAVRRGALSLAVGGILGGNTFDTLFAAFADVAYRDGSIYHAMEQGQAFSFVLTIAMTAVLLLGLLRRERRGFANIGFESPIVMLLYLAGTALLVFTS